MSPRQQNPLRRLADRPPALEGGIAVGVELDDDQRGVVQLSHGDVAVRLRAVGLSVPYPSGLERLLVADPDAQLVVVERAPRGLRIAAKAAGVSYLDLRGRGRVIAPGLVYVAEQFPDLGGMVSSKSSPFAPKASRVVRVLLSNVGLPWRLSDVAALADLNPGNVHRALSALVDQGLVERDEDAYVVADPGSLLEAWAEQLQPSRDRVRLPVEGELRPFVADLVERFAGHAVVSGELAAENHAPYLPAESAVVHVLSADRFAEVDQQRDRYPLVPAAGPASGQVLVDLPDAGVGDFRVVKDGLPLASPQQVYVDLARDRGRGRDAAEHLRHAVLGF